MVCAECGGPLAPGAAYCSACGREARAPGGAVSTSEQRWAPPPNAQPSSEWAAPGAAGPSVWPDPAPPPAATPPPKENKLPVVVSVGLLLLAGLVIVGKIVISLGFLRYFWRLT